MDTVRSWLDVSEVRRLAEGLMTPSHEKEIAQDQAGYSQEFEGYVSSSQVENELIAEEPEEASPVHASVISALAAARKVAEGSGMLQKSESLEEIESLEVIEEVAELRDLDLQKLMQSYKKWAELYEMRGMLLIGRQEEVVSDTLGNAKLTEMALRMLKSAPDSGSLFVKVGAKSCLQLVLLTSNHGLEAIGMMVNSPLSSSKIEQLSSLIVQDLT